MKVLFCDKCKRASLGTLYESIHKEFTVQLITHQKHIDTLPESPIKVHIQKRFNALYEDTDVQPNIILVEDGDNINGNAFRFAGNRGLLSDVWEEHEPRHPEFCRVFEWAAFILSARTFEALVLIHDEDGFLILIPEEIIEAHPDLKWVLTDKNQGGLSDPQPLY